MVMTAPGKEGERQTDGQQVASTTRTRQCSCSPTGRPTSCLLLLPWFRLHQHCFGGRPRLQSGTPLGKTASVQDSQGARGTPLPTLAGKKARLSSTSAPRLPGWAVLGLPTISNLASRPSLEGTKKFITLRT